jgi:hypothetical protein
MYRILLCLPLCLCLGSDRPAVERAAPNAQARADAVKDNGGALPAAAAMEKLAHSDPISFLENAIRHCSRDGKSYSLIMQKRESQNGELQPVEVIEVSFKESPYSVYFHWTQGARLAARVLYVAGENEGKMLVRPNGGLARFVAGDVVAKDVNSPEARNSGRYPINQFGFKKGMERTLASWKRAKDAGALNVEYLGRSKVKELDDRECYVLKRIAKEPENDGVKESLYYFDAENYCQTGVVLKNSDGGLVGAYWFRDVKFNPTFKKDQFDPAVLKPQ